MSASRVRGTDWTPDFIVIDGGTDVATALQRIVETTASWVVIRRGDAPYLYAFRVAELLGWPGLLERASGPRAAFVSLREALGLHEEDSSTETQDRGQPPPIDRSWRPFTRAPSVDRYVATAADGTPLAVGVPEGALERPTRGGEPEDRGTTGVPSEVGPRREPVTGEGPLGADWSSGSEPPYSLGIPFEPKTGAAAAEGLPVLEDEGTSPVRHPSIEPDRTPTAGGDLWLTVDLKRAPEPETLGGPVSVGPLPADWSSLDLSVVLRSAQIDFAGEGRGTVTIRRNQDSVPARIQGRVHQHVTAEVPFWVTADFYHGTRFCGSGIRQLRMDGASAVPVPRAPAGQAETRGTVVAEPAARAPDLTVRISRVIGSPGRLDWLVQTARFDGLPAQLRAQIDLEQEPAAEAAALFAEFTTLERGQHRKRIEGFGSRLWQRAPRMFRDVYWALWDHYQRPLTIQFISDEPHLPWELMRPVREDESEIHPPLALKHAVARWIERWDGYMRNRLPAGGIFTIAPQYATASRRLPRAQSEAQALIEHFAATRVDGKRLAVEALLETIPPQSPIGVLHFAGHGVFSRTAATESSIKLEDGPLAASDIARPEVGLGKACRTLVFFNACEVGATGSIFGEVGGWADAFCGRQFGGFIAPLWSVDDEDASTVAVELLEGVFSRHEPIGEVLRAVREKYGDISPTFFSYLYYGDVTARLGA